MNQNNHTDIVNKMEMGKMRKGYYNQKKDKLLKNLDKTVYLTRERLATRYSPEFIDTLSQDARKEYKKMMPDIPYIEGAMAKPLNSFLLITAQEVAVYKAMKKHGKSPAEAWEICHDAITARMEMFPRWKAWLMNKLMYSGIMQRRIRKRAENKEHLVFGDFEVGYLIGDGKDFDWGTDYLKCGNYNFVKSQGVEEFAPYVCLSDMALGKALGWGLIRTETLADGCDKCDFRFKKGTGIQISSKTPEVQKTIEKIIEEKK